MSRVVENFTGVDEMIKRLDALPRHVDRGLRASARQASAAGYRKGLKVMSEHGLSNGTVLGYRRWFTDVGPDGAVTLWLGRNVLRRAGEWESSPPSPQSRRSRRYRQRADVEFPPAVEAAIQAQVVPEIEKVYEGVAEREILKAVARG